MSSMDRKRIFKFVTASIFIAAFVALFAPFYAEILLAGIFAFAMEPTLGRWLQPRHFRWRVSVACILAAMFLVVAAPISVVGYKIYASIVQISKSGLQNTEVYKKVYELKAELVEIGTRIASRFGISDQFDLSGMSDDSFAKSVNAILAFFTGLVGQIPSLLISIFVFCAALYFFLAEAAILHRAFSRQGFLSKPEQERFIEILQRASYATVVTSVIIGVIQASIVGAGSILFSAGDFTVVFVVTFFCSFIPVIGAGPVAFALAMYKLLLGHTGPAVGLVVVAVIAGTTDNLVRPYLISSQDEDLHPVVSLLALIGALIIFGMPGLLLGPVIASVAVKIIPTLYASPSASAKEVASKNKI
jgi:predicted PurR-regulated permease PerM